MKTNLKKFLALTVLCMVIAIASCKGNSSEHEGTSDAGEANGITSGTEAPAANENSGSSPGTDHGAGPATDTVRSSTANGNGQ